MRPKRRRWILGACTVWGALCLAPRVDAVVSLFNSQGFENPPYTAGSALAGQNQWIQTASQTSANPPYPYAGVTTYGTPGIYGAQLVGVADTNIGANDYGAWGPSTYISPNAAFTPGSSGPTDNILVSWVETYAASATGNPFYGIEAFNGNTEVALAGIDATTGLMVVQNPTETDELGSNKIQFTAGTYYSFLMDLNYATQTYSDSVNGSLIDSESFVAAATQFTDADILTYVLGSGTANGTGYFDNYSVVAVPEPASTSVMALALVLLGMGRRFRRPHGGL
jgi:hypothetical protein